MLCVILVCMICLRWMVVLGLGWTRDGDLNVLAMLYHMLSECQCYYLRVITLIHCRHVVQHSRHLVPIIIHDSVRGIGAGGMNDRLSASLTLGEGW